MTTNSAVVKFTLASAFGAGMLLFPVPYGDAVKIPLGIATDAVQALGAGFLPAVVAGTCGLSAAATLLYTALTRPDRRSGMAEALLAPGPVWTVLRIAGAVTAVIDRKSVV